MCLSAGRPGGRVAVLDASADVAGLQTVRTFQAKCFVVTVFSPHENRKELWRENCLSYGIQVTCQSFGFLDLLFGNIAMGKFATEVQVQQHIEMYADHFDLNNSVLLCRQLLNIFSTTETNPLTLYFGWTHLITGHSSWPASTFSILFPLY